MGQNSRCSEPGSLTSFWVVVSWQCLVVCSNKISKMTYPWSRVLTPGIQGEGLDVDEAQLYLYSSATSVHGPEVAET